MLDWLDHLSLFTLGFSSLFPLVNPIGTALILHSYFAPCSEADRKSFALTIAFYSFVLGLSALLLGSWVLKFMGISVPTTQLAGGIFIASMGFRMLNAEPTKISEELKPDYIRTSLFFPFTFPLAVGPGCISVLITLSAHAHSPELELTLLRVGILAVSLLAVLICLYFSLRYSSTVIRRIGSQGSLILNRLMAFLVFCVGLQVALSGLSHSFPHLFQ